MHQHDGNVNFNGSQIEAGIVASAARNVGARVYQEAGRLRVETDNPWQHEYVVSVLANYRSSVAILERSWALPAAEREVAQ